MGRGKKWSRAVGGRSHVRRCRDLAAARRQEQVSSSDEDIPLNVVQANLVGRDIPPHGNIPPTVSSDSDSEDVPLASRWRIFRATRRLDAVRSLSSGDEMSDLVLSEFSDD